MIVQRSPRSSLYCIGSHQCEYDKEYNDNGSRPVTKTQLLYSKKQHIGFPFYAESGDDITNARVEHIGIEYAHMRSVTVRRLWSG
jgi:hypothetical protein